MSSGLVQSLAVLGLYLVTGTAFAVDAVPPTSTTATYGAWTKRCNTVAAADGAPSQVCEIAETLQERQTNQVIAQVAVGRLQHDAPLSLIFQVPSSVWLRTPVGFWLGDTKKDQPDYAASYFRCDGQSCFADLAATPDLLQAMKMAKTAALGLEDLTHRKVQLPVSLDGFADAYAATFDDAAN